MRKELSHNKKIKIMHEMTGLPYSVCRKMLKEKHWNLYRAMGFDKIGEILDNTVIALKPLINSICDAAQKIVEGLTEFISSIDWKTIKETVDEYNRQNSIEALPMEIPGEAAGAETGNDLS